jgi:hypothetical protein
MRISEDVPRINGDIEMIYAAGNVYIKLPPAFNKTGKPFDLVSTSSSDPVIRKLASTLNESIASGSLKTIRDFAASATTVKLVGESPAGTHYSVVVDATKLPASYPGLSALRAAGITTIPTDVYLDSQGRPVLINERLNVKGHEVTTKVTISRYNQPVTISAPPANQVARWSELPSERQSAISPHGSKVTRIRTILPSSSHDAIATCALAAGASQRC